MRFLTAIPVYNEEKYVQSVIDCVKNFSDDILVVNDGSRDASSSMAREQGAIVIDHPTNFGYGRALRTAFAYAADNAYDVMVTLDADKQHPPRYIPAFLNYISDFDIVSGSRYLAPQPENTPAPPERQRINRVITGIVNGCTGYRLTDSFCGFKAYSVVALKSLDLREDGYAMPLELWIQAAAHGLKVREIPVSLIYLDAQRSFGHELDNADKRLAYYREVIDREIQRVCVEQPTSLAACAGGTNAICDTTEE